MRRRFRGVVNLPEGLVGEVNESHRYRQEEGRIANDALRVTPGRKLIRATTFTLKANFCMLRVLDCGSPGAQLGSEKEKLYTLLASARQSRL